jgi:hypothetical protein
MTAAGHPSGHARGTKDPWPERESAPRHGAHRVELDGHHRKRAEPFVAGAVSRSDPFFPLSPRPGRVARRSGGGKGGACAIAERRRRRPCGHRGDVDHFRPRGLGISTLPLAFCPFAVRSSRLPRAAGGGALDPKEADSAAPSGFTSRDVRPWDRRGTLRCERGSAVLTLRTSADSGNCGGGSSWTMRTARLLGPDLAPRSELASPSGSAPRSSAAVRPVGAGEELLHTALRAIGGRWAAGWSARRRSPAAEARRSAGTCRAGTPPRRCGCIADEPRSGTHRTRRRGGKGDVRTHRSPRWLTRSTDADGDPPGARSDSRRPECRRPRLNSAGPFHPFPMVSPRRHHPMARGSASLRPGAACSNGRGGIRPDARLTPERGGSRDGLVVVPFRAG